MMIKFGGGCGKRKFMAFVQMFLLIGLSFAVAGILGEGVGRVQGLEEFGPPELVPDPIPGTIPHAPAVTGTPAQAPIIPLGESLTDSQVIAAQRQGLTIFEAPDGRLIASRELEPFKIAGSLTEGSGWNGLYTAEEATKAGFGEATNIMIDGKPVGIIKDSSGNFIGSDGTVFKQATDGSWSSAGKIAAPTPDKAAAPTFLESIFGGKAFGAGWGGALMSGAVWGSIVGFGSYYIAKMMGQTPGQAKSIGMGLGIGTFAGSTLYLYGANNAAALTAHPFLLSGGGAFIIGAGIAATIIILTYKKEKKEIVQFQCYPWEAPTGGRECEVCNTDPLLPCSEYRCKSLGQACEIVNAGSDKEMCVWVHPDDTEAPIITPWNDALRPKDELRYLPDNAVRPPARGAKISKLGEVDGCLQAYTKLEFGITTNEPAKCRIDYDLVTGFDNMSQAFGNSQMLLYNHTQKLRVPSPFTEAEEDGEDIPEIHTDGTYTLYTRCMDANGNFNIDAFSFRFCVQPGPDTTQPKIITANIPDGSPVQFGVDTIEGLEIYVDEPAECRWSRTDKAFSDMENTMSCATESYQINADLNYVCSGTLTGIKDREDNKFFFRCKDYAKENRNEMTSSFPLTLRGTEELVITKTGPSGVFEGSTSIATIYLTAETAHGADEGKAMCYFDNAVDGEFNIGMEFSDSYIHNQSLDLGAGSYNYYFKCVDDGGNAAYASTNFTIKIDRAVPIVARVYRELDTLTVVTDEKAKCAYSLTSCDYNFAEGVAMAWEDATKKTVHYAEWDTDATYYIKCADLQGNEPSPTACSIIAKGSEL